METESLTYHEINKPTKKCENSCRKFLISNRIKKILWLSQQYGYNTLGKFRLNFLNTF